MLTLFAFLALFFAFGALDANEGMAGFVALILSFGLIVLAYGPWAA